MSANKLRCELMKTKRGAIAVFFFGSKINFSHFWVGRGPYGKFRETEQLLAASEINAAGMYRLVKADMPILLQEMSDYYCEFSDVQYLFDQLIKASGVSTTSMGIEEEKEFEELVNFARESAAKHQADVYLSKIEEAVKLTAKLEETSMNRLKRRRGDLEPIFAALKGASDLQFYQGDNDE